MKGRNPHLIQKRNEHLIKRYYLWYELERMRMDDVLKHLEEKEIFLNKDYILYLLRQNSDLLKQIRKEKPTVRQLDSFTFTYQDEHGTDMYMAGTLFG